MTIKVDYHMQTNKEGTIFLTTDTEPDTVMVIRKNTVDYDFYMSCYDIPEPITNHQYFVFLDVGDKVFPLFTRSSIQQAKSDAIKYLKGELN